MAHKLELTTYAAINLLIYAVKPALVDAKRDLRDAEKRGHEPGIRIAKARKEQFEEEAKALNTFIKQADEELKKSIEEYKSTLIQ